jgi:hypothetical protein
MTYDYVSDADNIEFPNPYRFQNLVLFVCATFLFIASLYSLWGVMLAMNAGASMQAIAPLLLGLVLLGLGLSLVSTALRRLRFYFGRDKPDSLVQELAAGDSGSSEEAVELLETLRQGALPYREPVGPLEGLLFYKFPHLITAPKVVRDQALLHFSNLAAVFIVLLSFVFAFGLLGTDQTRPWISLLYSFFSSYWLLRPVTTNSRSKMKVIHLILLTVVGVMVPVILTLVANKLPNVEGRNLHVHTITLLVGILTGISCVFMAAISQITRAPLVGVSNLLSRQSMQSPPATLFDEIVRVLQNKWTERIPNRRYSHTEPETPMKQAGGAFNGEIFQETQPMPVLGRHAQGLSQLLSDQSRLYLLVTDVFGAFFTLTAVALSISFTHQMDTAVGLKDQPWYLLTSSLVTVCIGLFCFKNSAILWGRFDFQSDLIWIQAQGSYQVSKIGTGNQFSSQMQTQNELIRVEGMTLNIWRTRVESVVFGQKLGGQMRQIISMKPTDAEASDLQRHLQNFVSNQSVLVTPQSTSDSSKLQSLVNADRMALVSSGLGHATMAALQHKTQSYHNDDLVPILESEAVVSDVFLNSSRNTNKFIARAKFCHQCGTALLENANFCSSCGQNIS